MKLPRFAAFFIIALSLIGTLIFTSNNTIWITLICAAVMTFAVTILVIYEKPAMFFTAVFFVNYVMFIEGGHFSGWILLGLLLLISPVFLFLKKPVRIFPMLLPFCLLSFYYVLVLLLKPYAINTSWFTMHLQAVIILALTQFFSWNAEKIADVSKLHMLALVIYGIIEVTLFYQERIRGPMLSSTAYAIMLVTVWATWFSYELLKTKPRYISAVIYTILSTAIMIATGTRMAIIGIVITFALILFIRNFIINQDAANKKLLKFGAWGIAAALLVVTGWTLLPQDLLLKQNFEPLLRGEIDLSSLGRIFAWICGIHAFQESPLMGIGNGNFLQFVQQNYGHLPFPDFFLTIPHAHNATLVILSENGIIGMIVVSALVSIALLQFFRYVKQQNTPHTAYCLIIGFAVMYILSMLDAMPYYPSSMVWGAWFLGALIRLPVEHRSRIPLVKQPTSGV